MKKLGLFFFASALCLQAAFAEPGRHREPVPNQPVPRYSQEQITIFERNMVLGGVQNQSRIPLAKLLDLPNGTEVLSLVFIVNTNSRGVTMTLGNRRENLFSKELNPRLEVLQIPVNMRWSERSDLLLRVQGEAFLKSVGVTYVDNNGQRPPLPPGPNPRLPNCTLLPLGIYNGYSYSFRIAVGDQVLAGVNSFEDMLVKLKQIEDGGFCQRNPFPGACEVKGQGLYNGYSYNYRLGFENLLFAATNSIDSLESITQKFESENLCYMEATQKCELLGQGLYNGYSYNYRLKVGETIHYGTNDLDSISKMIARFRTMKMCY